jgi:membrane-bound ClpP family serine protease
MKGTMHLLRLLLLPTFTHAFIMSIKLNRQQFLTQSVGVSSGILLLSGDANADDISSSVVKRKLNKIHFNGDVSIASCEALRQAIDDGASESKTIQMTYSLSTPPPLELHIQSVGGSLMATLAVVDTITSCDVPVHSYV